MTTSFAVDQGADSSAWRRHERTIIARTSRATIYQEADGSIAKQYHCSDAVDRVRQDERSLGRLSGALGNGRDADGWRYTVARPLRVDLLSGTIWLERAPGQPVFALPVGALLDAEHHVGIWLATYHNRLLGKADEGLIYADTNLSNILVDPVGRVVTGLDPGSGWGQVGNRYQDLVRHVYSLVMVLLLRRRGALPAVRSFLYGYASVTRGRMTARAYAIALGREVRRRWIHYGLKSRAKQLAFAASSLLLAPLFTVYVPGTLAYAIRVSRRSGKQGITVT